MTEPTDDLQQRCAECIEWQQTGELRQGALRAYADKHWHGHHDSLQMAERATETQAMEAVARWGTQAQAGAVPLTDEQIEALPLWKRFVGLWPETRREIVRTIERHHGIKGGQHGTE